MQNAETVLGVIRQRGRQGLPVERLYRQLFNKQLFLMAYGRIYSNKGSMTPGVTGETVDGMSLAKIDAIIGRLRTESYRWSPVRRTYIPKRNGRLRPLGLPTWSDKLVAEVVRLLLEAFYDVQFSERSHGFRPGRGCHTALQEVAATWTGTHWFVEGDLADYFGSLDHQIMLSTLARKIHDGRFLVLIDRMLKAGYLEDWRWNATLSGAPQGGPASPILSNIYLDRFDRFVEQQLIPHYTRGEVRRRDPAYSALKDRKRRARKLGERDTVRELTRRMHAMPSGDPQDPGYRRLHYVRYCDDFLLGFAGPRREAEEIKARIGQFLRDELRLKLSEEKTLITHAASQAARFLGYEIRTQHRDTKITRGRRAVNGVVGLYVPESVVQERCSRYMRAGKPEARSLRVLDHDYTIVARYQAEFRGVVEFYLLALNVSRLCKLRWVMETSLLKTLAEKHATRVRAIARKHKAIIATPHGPRTCIQVTVPREGRRPLVATFGGIPIKRKRTTVIIDYKVPAGSGWRNELIHRLLAGQCEMCGARGGLHVHHIRKLADLSKPGRPERPTWVRMMARRKRKTLVVCEPCHHNIHAGRATSTTRNRK